MTQDGSEERENNAEKAKDSLIRFHQVVGIIALPLTLIAPGIVSLFSRSLESNAVRGTVFVLSLAFAVGNFYAARLIRKARPQARAASIFLTLVIFAAIAIAAFAYIFSSPDWGFRLAGAFLLWLSCIGIPAATLKPEPGRRRDILTANANSILVCCGGLLLIVGDSALLFWAIPLCLIGLSVPQYWKQLALFKTAGAAAPSPVEAPPPGVRFSGPSIRNWRQNPDALPNRPWAMTIFAHWTTPIISLLALMIAPGWDLPPWQPSMLMAIGIVNLLIGEGLYRQWKWMAFLSLAMMPVMAITALIMVCSGISLHSTVADRTLFGTGVFLAVMAFMLFMSWQKEYPISREQH